MDLLHLEHFLAVAESGSFSRAAQQVFRTQPAVSQSVRRLEAEIGLPLFVRSGHDVTLTEAGMRLVAYARRLLHLREEAMHALADLRHFSSGSVSIASIESAALYLLPGVIRCFWEQCPHIKVSVHRSLPHEIPREVLDREVDLGVVREEPTFGELRSLEIYSDTLIVVASPRHRLAGRSDLRIEDFGHERFIIHYPSTVIAETVVPLFQRCDTPLRMIAELWSFSTIKELVSENVGVTIVPRVTVLRELAAGSLVELPMEGLEVSRRYIMIFREQRHMSEPARKMLNIVARFDWSHWLESGVPRLQP